MPRRDKDNSKGNLLDPQESHLNGKHIHQEDANSKFKLESFQQEFHQPNPLHSKSRP